MNNEIIIRTDPLGGFSLYWSFLGGGNRNFLISDNPKLIAALQEQIGSRPTRSALNAMFNITYLTSFGHTSPYEGIETNYGPVELRVRSESLAVRQCAVPWVSGEGVAYKDLIPELSHVLTTNAMAIHEFCETHGISRRVVDLSGGKDSRLVLASLIAAGIETEFGYYTGSSSDQDHFIAARIRRNWGLRKGSIFSASPNDTMEHNSRQGYGQIERIRRGVGRYFGHISHAYSHYGDATIPSYVRVTGIHGELGISMGPNLNRIMASNGTYNRSAESAPPFEGAFAEVLFQKNIQGSGDALNLSRFLSDEGRRQLHDGFYRAIRGVGDSNVFPMQMPTLFYAFNRSRFHAGTRLVEGNRANLYFSPLATPLFFAAGRSGLTYAQLKDRKLIYDLIANLAGQRLADFPLAEDHWRPKVYPLGPRSSQYRLRRREVPVRKPFLFSPTRPINPVRSVEEADYRTGSVPLGQEVSDLIESIPTQSDLWALFGRKDLIKWAREIDPGNDRGDLLKRLMASLLFYEGRDIWTPLSDELF